MQTNRKIVSLDSEGYLREMSDWDDGVAEQLAELDGFVLTESHWEVITVLRNFYQQHQLSPPMRPMINLLRSELGADKGRSIYLMKLFGGSPARQACKVAGLPRPKNCI